MFATTGFRKISELLIIGLCLFFAAALSSCAENDLTRSLGDPFGFFKSTAEDETCPALQEKPVRNIILLIGDGMGLGQVALAQMATVGADGKLHMQKLPISGLLRTHSAGGIVTDSAAAATAMACGIKTNNGVISMDPAGNKYMTILEATKEKIMRTGLVATSAITHATPACFGAHVKDRDNEVVIAEQLLANKINVLLGGGRIFFLPKENGGERKDKRNLIEKAKKAGYHYIGTGKQLADARGPFLLGLFQDEGLTTFRPEPTLSELTDKAIEILNKNNKGFFLMVEGSQIDWACHDNDKYYAVKQTVDFDEAVKTAVDFATADGRTLVIVTADHETGGLIVLDEEEIEGINTKCSWATDGHSAMPVPVYAFGPGATDFAGVYDNTQLPKKMAKLLGIKQFPKALE
ncbi:alkaline phosphatase [Planctomycetota bacterium]